MKSIFKAGDEKTYEVVVKPEDTAQFDGGQVHPFYATFALARDAEWCGRLFVLEMKEDDEEGIGTMIRIEHLAPALVKAKVKFIARVKSIEKNEIITTFEAWTQTKDHAPLLIARGETGQKILKKEQLESLNHQIHKH